MSSPALPLLFFGGLEFSVAELSAARIDGEVVAVGDGFAPVGLPVDVRHRAAALAADVPLGYTLVGRSAAWVHGASARCPVPVEIGGSGPAARWARPYRSVRTMRIRDDHRLVVVVGRIGVPVLSPVATVIDLARLDPTPSEAALMTAVVRRCRLTRESLLDSLDDWTHLPGKRHIAERLRAATAGASES
ncbi:hypothetical protein [Labedella endophytica]|uniref:AbiEi antitoxin C-terminal domain-containing protein n=1 Tax=Labedella endophytica TaxID=1523160 RepID=A0A433JQY9_9MICO|nr:hypothetical protein [Labedella endophytica]RUR00733.1 hypothetical protein ELQ94_03995 [Labedella endophytica]